MAADEYQSRTYFSDDVVGAPPSRALAQCVVMLTLVTSVIAGCGGSGVEVYPAKGKVEFSDGTPVTGGSVSFRSDQGSGGITAKGQIRPDGTFSLTTFTPDDGAVPGKHQALVVSMLVGDRETLDPSRTPQLDPRFSNYNTSGLEFDVSDESAKNDFTIVVEKRR